MELYHRLVTLLKPAHPSNGSQGSRIRALKPGNVPSLPSNCLIFRQRSARSKTGSDQVRRDRLAAGMLISLHLSLLLTNRFMEKVRCLQASPPLHHDPSFPAVISDIVQRRPSRGDLNGTCVHVPSSSHDERCFNLPSAIDAGVEIRVKMREKTDGRLGKTYFEDAALKYAQLLSENPTFSEMSKKLK